MMLKSSASKPINSFRWLINLVLGLLAVVSITSLILLGLRLLSEIQVAQDNLALTDENIDLDVRPFTRAQRQAMEIRVTIQREDFDPLKLRNQQTLMLQVMQALENPLYSDKYPPNVTEGLQELLTEWDETINPKVRQLIIEPDNQELRGEVDELMEDLELNLDDLSTENGIHRLGQAGKLNRQAEAVVTGMQSSLQLAGVVGGVFVIFASLAYLNTYQINRQREHSRQELALLNEELEARVASRTRELEIAAEQARISQQAAEKANQVKSQFLAAMSHELRTPLNGILNFTQFVSSGMLGEVNDKQKETLDKATGNGEHLLSLINDILDVSKMESGSLKLLIEDHIDVQRDILKPVMDTATALLEDKPVELKMTVAPDLPKLRADKRRVRQILLNLVSNACKFTQQGYIHVRVQQEQDHLRIEVEDTGTGIPVEDHEQIFEAFVQAQAGLRYGGTGLGLPISRRLAEAHGGKLWVESENGKGTTFIMHLPLKSDHLTPIIPSAI